MCRDRCRDHQLGDNSFTLKQFESVKAVDLTHHHQLELPHDKIEMAGRTTVTKFISRDPSAVKENIDIL
jgi:hypothetical protein